MSITDELRPTTPAVDAISKINLTGNTTPRAWYQCDLLKYPSGKVYLTAITLLSDICYWYTRTEHLDERSGRVDGYGRKFYGNMLWKDYKDWGVQFGLTEREVRDAIAHLVKVGLIVREVERPSNKVFIEPVAAAVTAITFPDGSRPASQREPAHVITGAALRQDVMPPTFEREPYTKSTAKNTSKTSTTVIDENSKELTTAEHGQLYAFLINARVEPRRAKSLLKKYPERARLLPAWWETQDESKMRSTGAMACSFLENPERHPLQSIPTAPIRPALDPAAIEAKAQEYAQREYNKLSVQEKHIVDLELKGGKAITEIPRWAKMVRTSAQQALMRGQK